MRLHRPPDLLVERQPPGGAVGVQVREGALRGPAEATRLGVPPPVAVDAAVRTVRGVGLGSAAGLVNAVLRRLAREGADGGIDLGNGGGDLGLFGLCQKHLFPGLFFEGLNGFLPLGEPLQALGDGFQGPPPANQLKADSTVVSARILQRRFGIVKAATKMSIDVPAPKVKSPDALSKMPIPEPPLFSDVVPSKR